MDNQYNTNRGGRELSTSLVVPTLHGDDATVAMKMILAWSAVATVACAGAIGTYGAYGNTYDIRADITSDRAAAAVEGTGRDRDHQVEPAGFGVRPDAELFDVKLREVGANLLELSIVNRTNEPITFIEPQPGSHRGWIQPTYELEAYDAAGRRLEMSPAKAGTVSASIDLKTAHVVAPGRRFVTNVSTDMFGQPIAKVRVRYRFDSARVPLSAGDKMLLRTRPVREMRVAGGAEMQQRLATLFNGELKSAFLEPTAAPR